MKYLDLCGQQCVNRKLAAHWNRNDLVVIDFHGRTVTVFAPDLERAIHNARNHD